VSWGLWHSPNYGESCPHICLLVQMMMALIKIQRVGGEHIHTTMKKIKKICLISFVYFFSILSGVFAQKVCLYSNVYYESDTVINFENNSLWELKTSRSSYIFKFHSIITDTITEKIRPKAIGEDSFYLINIIPIQGHLTIVDYNYRNKEANYIKKNWDFKFIFESNFLSSQNSSVRVSSINNYKIVLVNAFFYNAEFTLPIKINGSKLDIQDLMRNNTAVFDNYEKDEIFFRISSFVILINGVRYFFKTGV
jgi:hypothetical protein